MVKKEYLTIVDTEPEAAGGEFHDFLYFHAGKNSTVVCNDNQKGAKPGVMRYEVLGSLKNYWLLRIVLKTGRKHQIRAQLRKRGVAIRGDVKYGARRTNREGGISLLAWKLTFSHPVTRVTLEIDAPLPQFPIWQACSGFVL